MTHLTPWQRLKYAGLMQRKYDNCTVNVWMSPGHYYFDKPIAINEVTKALDSVFQHPYFRDNLNDVDIVFQYSLVQALGTVGTRTVAFVKSSDLFGKSNILFINLNVARKAAGKPTQQYAQIFEQMYKKGSVGEEFDLAMLGKELENTIAHEMTHIIQEHITQAGRIKNQRIDTATKIFRNIGSLSEKSTAVSLDKLTLDKAINLLFVKIYKTFTHTDLYIYREGVASFMGDYASGRYGTDYKGFMAQSKEAAKETKSWLSTIEQHFKSVNGLVVESITAKKPLKRDSINEKADSINKTALSIKRFYELGYAIPAILFRYGGFTIEQIGAMGDHKLINEYTDTCLKNNLEILYTNRPGVHAIVNISDFRASLHKLRKEILQNIKELEASQAGKWH
ncbi:hypothetical protein JXB28_01365 [Candidatus Woesearchaeota archaeon]|nr:hypothetical protein [Candidatus Woesearchaeota archaeon]